jgi:hypothetical protein
VDHCILGRAADAGAEELSASATCPAKPDRLLRAWQEFDRAAKG